jgi:hypothetical protein
MANQMSAADMAELEKKLKRIEELSKKFNSNINTLNLQPLEDNAGAIEAIFESLEDKLAQASRNTDYLVDSFKDLVNEIKKSRSGLGDATKSLKSLTTISEELVNHQKGYNELSSKDLIKLQEKVKIERARLTSTSQRLEDEAYELTLQKNSNDFARMSVKEQQALLNKLNQTKLTQESINNLLSNQDITLSDLNTELAKEVKLATELEKKLGLTKVALDGINKIPFLNGVIDTNKALDAAKQKIKEGGSRTQAFGAAFSTVGKQIVTHLSDPLVVVGFLVTELISAFKSVDSGIGDLAKGFDMTYNSAANLRNELNSIANTSLDAAVTTKGLQESMVAIGQTLGSNARLNDADLVTFTKLREQAGYTNDELAGIQKLTLATGGNLEDNTASFLGSVAALNGQNKLTINAKQLLKEVANVSDSIKLSIGGTTEKLAEAAFKAKQFGINLEQADQISSNLLDFESSIANELSAELITGKDLNLEKARLLAINGDIAGAGAEILKQVGGTAEFTKMNRIQQEALAKATGLSRDDLAKSLMDREALTKLSGIEGADAKEKYDNLVKQVGVEEAKKRLGDEALANQFQQQSVQERFTQSIEKLKELFVSLLSPLMPIFDIFADIMGVVGPIAGILGQAVKFAIELGKYLLPVYGIFKGIQLAQKISLTQSVAQYSISKLQKTEDMGINAVRLYRNSIEKEGLITKIAYNAQLLIGLIREQGLNGLKLFANTLDEKSVARKVILGALAMKDAAIENFKTGRMIAQRGAALGYNAILLARQAILSGELAKAVGIAAAYAIANPLMALVGLAVAAGVGALVYSQMKDGIIDPNKGPVLSGGFGSVQLDPKDKAMYGADGAIKVGTNLGGKGSGTSSQQDNSALINEMRAMRQEQSRSNNKPVIVENSMNSTKFGTSVAMNTYKVQ